MSEPVDDSIEHVVQGSTIALVHRRSVEPERFQPPEGASSLMRICDAQVIIDEQCSESRIAMSEVIRFGIRAESIDLLAISVQSLHDV